MALDLLKPTSERHGLLGVEKLTLLYAGLTSVAIVVLWGHMHQPLWLLAQRWLLCAGMMVPIGLHRWRPVRLTKFLRMFYVLALLGYWYPDTYNVCHALPYLDHVFASVDQEIFGFQPSIRFARMLPEWWVSEPMFLGYFSYYPLIVLTVFFALLRKYRYLERTAFIVLCSFFLFYTIYLFVPVAGPQYYNQLFTAPMLEAGVCPEVPAGFFDTHVALPLDPSGPHGFFESCVRFMQSSGERPTAAFPSSHVGICTVLILLARRMSRRLMWAMVPFYVLLCLSTVYIGAHYAIDAVMGLPAGFLAYRLSWRIYYTPFFHRKHH